jgi:phosphoketolase
LTTPGLERQPLSIDACRRAANLVVGRSYLYYNPLPIRPLELSHIEPLVVGEWGTTPGRNFIYAYGGGMPENLDWSWDGGR